MTDQEILEKAIQKAIDGGWEPFYENWSVCIINTGGVWGDPETCEHASIEEVIFNHDFAKALWGDEWPRHSFDITPQILYWQYHIREMVIADDPIKYLGDNL